MQHFQLLSHLAFTCLYGQLSCQVELVNISDSDQLRQPHRIKVPKMVTTTIEGCIIQDVSATGVLLTHESVVYKCIMKLKVLVSMVT